MELLKVMESCKNILLTRMSVGMMMRQFTCNFYNYYFKHI